MHVHRPLIIFSHLRWPPHLDNHLRTIPRSSDRQNEFENKIEPAIPNLEQKIEFPPNLANPSSSRFPPPELLKFRPCHRHRPSFTPPKPLCTRSIGEFVKIILSRLVKTRVKFFNPKSFLPHYFNSISSNFSYISDHPTITRNNVGQSNLLDQQF